MSLKFTTDCETRVAIKFTTG